MVMSLENMNNGKIVFTDKEINAKDLEWNESDFDGVYLKHLVEGSSTNNTLSCHIVKIKAGCHIDNHIHEGKLELNEVLEGHGKAVLDGKEIKCEPGATVVIPADVGHDVTAGDEDLYLLAKFTPALL